LRKRSVLKSLERFAQYDLTLSELSARLSRGRRATTAKTALPYFGLGAACPARAVEVSRRHLEAALAKTRMGELSARDLVNWATMILINDVFFWSGEDADLIGQWICEISLDLDENLESGGNRLHGIEG
jgi:hypothetical protein